MVLWKGSTIVGIRNLVHKAGLEKQFLTQLNQKEKELYHKTIPITWITADQFATMVEKAAQIFFPDDALAVRKVGEILAKEQLNSIYRFLLRMSSVPFVLQQAPTLWRIYADQGKIATELNEENKQAVVIIQECPELSKVLREEVAGFVLGTASFTSGKNFRVDLDESDPQAWRYSVTWE